MALFLTLELFGVEEVWRKGGDVWAKIWKLCTKNQCERYKQIIWKLRGKIEEEKTRKIWENYIKNGRKNWIKGKMMWKVWGVRRSGQDKKMWDGSSRHLHQITAFCCCCCTSATPAYFAAMKCAIAYLAFVLHTLLGLLCRHGEVNIGQSVPTWLLYGVLHTWLQWGVHTRLACSIL